MPNKNKLIATIDGNEAAAYVAYRVNEICAIYPITPSSTMAELADEWFTADRRFNNHLHRIAGVDANAAQHV